LPIKNHYLAATENPVRRLKKIRDSVGVVPVITAENLGNLYQITNFEKILTFPSIGDINNLIKIKHIDKIIFGKTQRFTLSVS